MTRAIQQAERELNGKEFISFDGRFVEDTALNQLFLKLPSEPSRVLT